MARSAEKPFDVDATMTVPISHLTAKAKAPPLGMNRKSSLVEKMGSTRIESKLVFPDEKMSSSKMNTEAELVQTIETMRDDVLNWWVPEREQQNLTKLRSELESSLMSKCSNNSTIDVKQSKSNKSYHMDMYKDLCTLSDQISSEQKRIDDHATRERIFFSKVDELQKLRVSRALASGPIATIVGPISLSQHWNPAFKKMVYIFGDYHTRLPHCDRVKGVGNHVAIADFFEVVLRQQREKLIDIFLEIGFMKDHVNDNTLMRSTLYKEGHLFGDVKIQWRDCLKKDKNQCIQRFPNLRMHYVDVRLPISQKSEPQDRRFIADLDLLTSLKELFENPIDDVSGLSINKSDELHRAMFTAAKTFAREYKFYSYKVHKPIVLQLMDRFDKPEYLIDNLLSLVTHVWSILRWDEKNVNHPITEKDLFYLAIRRKTIRQLINVRNDKVRAKLYEFFITKRIKGLLGDTVKFYENLIRLVDDVCLGKTLTYELKREVITDADSLGMREHELYIMDLYTMARLFRNFYSDDVQRQSVQHAIIYVGDAHANSYRQFLTDIGFKTINAVMNQTTNRTHPDSRCIPLDKFTQPFFADIPA